MTAPTQHRLTPLDDMRAVHALLMDAFAYMASRIDPPSSLLRMHPTDLAQAAATGEVWIAGDTARLTARATPMACMVLTARADTLYLGKFAIAPPYRGRGLARQMIEHAAARARARGLASVTLETRVELSENQAAFCALGFVETGRSAHAGYDAPTSITYRRPA